MSEVKESIEKGVYVSRYGDGLCRVKREFVDPITREKILEGDSRKFEEFSWNKTRWNSEGLAFCNGLSIGKKFDLNADNLTEEYMHLCYEMRSVKSIVLYLQRRVTDLEAFKAHLEKPTWLKKLRAKFKRR